jgi:hypothetical protein
MPGLSFDRHRFETLRSAILRFRSGAGLTADKMR